MDVGFRLTHFSAWISETHENLGVHSDWWRGVLGAGHIDPSLQAIHGCRRDRCVVHDSPFAGGSGGCLFRYQTLRQAGQTSAIDFIVLRPRRLATWPAVHDVRLDFRWRRIREDGRRRLYVAVQRVPTWNIHDVNLRR